MVGHYHMSLLLLIGLAVAATVAAVDGQPGGKKVTITMRYVAAAHPLGKKFRISLRYADEDHGSDDQFQLDCDDDEPLGVAMQYLLTVLEEQRDYVKASRSEL